MIVDNAIFRYTEYQLFGNIYTFGGQMPFIHLYTRYYSGCVYPKAYVACVYTSYVQYNLLARDDNTLERVFSTI